MNKPKHMRSNCMNNRYLLAQRFEHEYAVESMILNAQIYPNWIQDSNCFWYIRKIKRDGTSGSPIAHQYRLVNPETGDNSEAFDQLALARSLGQKSGRSIDPGRLPIKNIRMQLFPLVIRFDAFNQSWEFDQSRRKCSVVDIELDSFGVVSPDGTKVAYLNGFDIWIRDKNAEHGRALTTDGTRHWSYGSLPERVNLVSGLNEQVSNPNPEVLWSPDSSKILTVRTDERNVSSLPVTEYVPPGLSQRPRATLTKYAFPGDTHIPQYKVISIEVESGIKNEVSYPPISDSVLVAGLFSGNRAWWSDDSMIAYFLDVERGQKKVVVVSFNTDTGLAKVIFEEECQSYIEFNLDYESPALLKPIPETNELIWFSQRSGWAHLYLYDLVSGQLKNCITSGEWVVRDVLHYHKERRELIIQASGRVSGRDPYYREVIRVNIDTGKLQVLASSDHDYIVRKPNSIWIQIAVADGRATAETSGVSPDSDYIVVTRTRVDEASVSIVLNRQGQSIMEIEQSDTSGLPVDWQWPEPVVMKAADNKTSIYGVVFKPSGYSAHGKYPVIDFVIGSPFYSAVPKGIFGVDSESSIAYSGATALAELGFIVTVLDGRGTCYRSKAFHDESYGQLEDGCYIHDHVVGLRQLAERFPAMDLDRVGILDNCSGNAACALFMYPEFYKVGCLVSPWDPALIMHGEVYQGIPPASFSDRHTKRLQADEFNGKLLLMHGMLDPFFQVSATFKVAEALIQNNKDFDLLLLPNGGHGSSRSCHYGRRRTWDYFVIHLLHSEPPSNFQLKSGQEYLEEKIKEDFF